MFSPNDIRGRGASLEAGGEVAFHDGVNTIGRYDKNRLFQKKPQIDMGLDAEPATPEYMRDLRRACELMNFETNVDCYRLLGWSLIAPFTGVLPWRPALLITGQSKSGKSSVAQLIVKKIALFKMMGSGERLGYWAGGYSTEAGARQAIKNDAMPILLEEMESDTEKKRLNREALFSLMRQSSGEDAPKVVKGTADQGGQMFDLRSMFCFVAIDPEVEAVADANRIFNIEIKNRGHNPETWFDIKSKVSGLLTEENVKKIHALTWQKLPEILKFAKKIQGKIQEITKKDLRYCLSDGLMFSAYYILVRDWPTEDAETIEAHLRAFYGLKKLDHQRDQASELFDTMLETLVWSNVGGNNTRRSIMELLNTVYQMPPGSKSDSKDILNRYGITVTRKMELAISVKNTQLKKELGRPQGYDGVLARCEHFIERRQVRISGTVSRCLVFDAKWFQERGGEIDVGY
jgi:hypothetical protein